jgi:tetratricopeptide (TPR) repeat protein
VPKKPKKPNPGLSLRNLWLWVTVGVVVLVILLFLSRILSQPPKSEPGRKTAELTKVDLSAYTRMLGKVYIDTTVRTFLSPELNRQLVSIDTMIENRELRDAIARLTKLLQKKELRKDSIGQAVVYGYIGFSYNELAQPQSALVEFQKGLELTHALSGRAASCITGWLAFNTGYIFQYYSYPESALFYYRLAERSLSTLTPSPADLAGAILNNLGVAAEFIGDSIGAKEAFIRATMYIDTTVSLDQSRGLNAAPALRLKRNLHR